MEVKKLVEENLNQTVEFLKELIKSISGEGEEEIQNFICEKFSEFGKVNLIPIPEEIKKDPEYTFSDKELDYSKRKNLVLKIGGKGGGKSLILNSHSNFFKHPNFSSIIIFNANIVPDKVC